MKKPDLSHIPARPWIYQMKNKSGKILYIGKSKNLKARVNSYFVKNASLNFAKKKMITQVATVDIVETKSDSEALILETNFIKEYQPKYNVLMKDDKNLSYIAITNEDIPEVYTTRKPNKTVKKFWPFDQYSNLRKIIKDIKAIFQVRDCAMKFENENGNIKITSKAGRNIPCLDHYIGICPAPCTLKPRIIKTHQDNVAGLQKFLQGDSGEVFANLEKTMQQHVEKHEFEQAAKVRDKIKSLQNITQKQIVRDAIPGNHDVLSLLTKYDTKYLGVTHIRDGKVVGVHSYTLKNTYDNSPEELLADCVSQKYAEYSDKKITLILSHKINSQTKEFLKTKSISATVPTKGNKKDILTFTHNHIYSYAHKQELQSLQQKTLTKTTQKNILKTLGYEVPKKWDIIFECYDISHLQGQHTVASRSVIINGKTNTSKYKKYKLKTLEQGKIDDFASMKEIMSRRAVEIGKQGNAPHLIVIDGGKGQLSSAKEGLGDTHVPLCSIAKKQEEVFLPDNSESIIFPRDEQELMLLQRIRDEAHRFAIGYNRQKRLQENKKTVLEQIPWIGAKTRQKLLKKYGSLQELSQKTQQELQTVITKKQIQALVDHGIIS